MCNPGHWGQNRVNNKIFYEIKVIMAMTVLLLDLYLPIPIIAKFMWQIPSHDEWHLISLYN